MRGLQNNRNKHFACVSVNYYQTIDRNRHKNFLESEQFRLFRLALQSPFPTIIPETLAERLCMLFLCFWSLSPQAIDEFLQEKR